MRRRNKRERIALTDKVVKRRCRIARANGMTITDKKEFLHGVPRGRLRKWNFTCGCSMCRHKSHGQHYKAKGAAKERRPGVIYV